MPNIASTSVEQSDAPAADEQAPARRLSARIAVLAGVLLLAGVAVLLAFGREPEGALASAFACPPGAETRSGRMQVTAHTLNVRAEPGASAKRLPDRTLRRNAIVAEECRADRWSRVRLADGRAGWVANEYLGPVSRTR
jgi:hypothetical protein